MPRSKEREEARKRMIEAAAVYLDAGGVVEALLLETTVQGKQLQIELKLSDPAPVAVEIFADGAE